MKGEPGYSVSVLDHGFVNFVTQMGDEDLILFRARQSYQKGTKKVRDDRELLRYLFRNRHTTPFEAPVIEIQIKCPIFVARQLLRHRTLSVNEMSGRYSILPDEVYIPDLERIQMQSTTNKQGSGEQLTLEQQQAIQEDWQRHAHQTRAMYDTHIEGFDLSRELARLPVGVNQYTQFSFGVNLHNLLHLLSLRDDPHAQWEIQQYAKIIDEHVAEWVPNVHEAYVDYRKEAVTFSKKELDHLACLVSSIELHKLELKEELTGLSKREKAEFFQKLGY